MYDTIIIGSGPAGMTAAVYTARREMKTLVIGKELGGQLVWASEIENYPGFKNIVSFDLIEKMRDQVTSLGVDLKSDEVKSIEKQEDGTFKIFTNKEEFEAKTVIIAMGLSPRRLAIPGEEKFNGKGVSYCANCDGPFYRDKIVAVVGSGNSAFDAAEILSKISKKVYLIIRNEEFKAFDALVKEVQERENIDVLVNSSVKEILGSDKVEKIICHNNKENSDSELLTDGVFVEIGRIASTDLVDSLVEKDSRGQIIINTKGETKTKGVFAAGDVTNISEFKQITVAVGQATIAALSAYQYLQTEFGHKKSKIIH